jgi:hypothetical protein
LEKHLLAIQEKSTKNSRKGALLTVNVVITGMYNCTSMYRDGILRLLRSPGIDSKESIPPAYVALALSATVKPKDGDTFQSLCGNLN